jgi:hypothetical protein
MGKSDIHFTFPAALAASRTLAGSHVVLFVIDTTSSSYFFFSQFSHLKRLHSGWQPHATSSVASHIDRLHETCRDWSVLRSSDATPSSLYVSIQLVCADKRRLILYPHPPLSNMSWFTSDSMQALAWREVSAAPSCSPATYDSHHYSSTETPSGWWSLQP